MEDRPTQGHAAVESINVMSLQIWTSNVAAFVSEVDAPKKYFNTNQYYLAAYRKDNNCWLSIF